MLHQHLNVFIITVYLCLVWFNDFNILWTYFSFYCAIGALGTEQLS